MLAYMRRKAQSIFIQATVVIIAVVFIFWGVGSGRRGGGNELAVVNDEVIPYQAYQQTFDRALNLYKEQLGDNLPRDIIEKLGIKEQVLDQLIKEVLLKQGAAQMGLMVSNLEVKQAIQQMETFRSNGIFDFKRYESVLQNSRLTPEAFEASMRSDLISTKVMDSLSRFASVSSSEARDQFNYDYEEINLEYVALNADDFARKIETDDEKLAAYFEENKERYKTDPQVMIQYLLFSYADDLKDAEVSEDALQSYYQQNIDRYTSKEKRHARHILIRTTEKDSEATLAEKQQRAANILAEVRAGGEFAELAKKYSEDPSAPDGGDLGTFSRGQMVEPFDKAVFSLAEGEISDVVQTPFGFHIIKVEESRPFRIQPLAEVREKVAAAIRENKGKSATVARAADTYEKIILAGSLEKYGESAGATIPATDFFTRSAPPGGEQKDILAEFGFLNTAFSLKKGELSSLVELPQGYAIIHVRDRKEPETAPLESVKENVRRDYIDSRAEALARETAEHLLAAWKDAKTDEEISKIIDGTGGTLTETGFIARSNLTAGTDFSLKLPPQVLAEGFELSTKRPFPEKIRENGRTFYAFMLKADREPPSALFADKKDEISARLKQEKQLALLSAWLENLKNRAEISINDQFL